MSASGFTARQRRTVLLMVTAVIVVFAMLAGLVVATIQGWNDAVPVPPPTFVSLPPTPVATLAPVASPVPEEGIWSQVQAARLFDQIAHQVETLRGLSPRAEVPLSFLDQSEMTALLCELYTGRGSETQRLPYAALGLVPDVPVTVQPHQAAGVYVASQEQLYVATGPQQSSVDDQALLAHAYAHALQDQHFDLGGMDARAVTTDAAWAIQALVEGDAMLLTALYRYDDLAAADWEHLAGLVLRAERPSYGEALDRDPAWTRLQQFPYWEGRQFVDVLFQAGGWAAIDAAYTDPPRSTEQVLHPERYLEERDAPAGVVVPDLGEVLGERWSVLVQDTLGEFVVGLYLDAMLPGEMAWRAASGWDGDTFVVWEHEDGSRVLVWRTIWDSTAEAAEFERARVALLLHQYLPVWPIDPPRGLTGDWWETEEGAVYVSRAGRYVLTVYAPDVGTLANVAEALP